MAGICAAGIACGSTATAQTAKGHDAEQCPAVHAGMETQRQVYLKVRLTLNMDSLRLKRNRSRVFTPVLTDGTNRKTLRPITVNGRWRQLMYRRGLEEKETDAMVVECGRHGAGSVEYADSCIYSSWMKEAGLWLAEDVCGCGGDVLEQSLRPLEAGIVAIEEEVVAPAPVLPPPAKNVQHKVEKVTLYLNYLTFPTNRTEILPDFGENRRELGKLESALDSLLALPRTDIGLVEITGYASPEGPYQRNEELAYKRTLALRDFLQETVRYRELPYRTASMAEDWEGLKAALERSGMVYREELMMIIAAHLPPDKKEENMKKLDAGKAYKLLEQHILPQLRRTVCEIHYTEEGQDNE